MKSACSFQRLLAVGVTAAIIAGFGRSAMAGSISMFFDVDGTRLVWFLPQGRPVAPLSPVSVGGTSVKVTVPDNLGNFAKIAIEDPETGNAALFVWTPTTTSITVSQSAFTYAAQVNVMAPQAAGHKATLTAPNYRENSQIDQTGTAHFYCVPLGPVNIEVSDINGPSVMDSFNIEDSRPQPVAILNAGKNTNGSKDEIFPVVIVLALISIAAATVGYVIYGKRKV